MVTMIIVDYMSMDKTYNYISECIKQIAGIDNYVIVENSPDETPRIETTRCEDKEVLVVYSGENLGYARGNNLGVSESKKKWISDYYLFSNNDLHIPIPFDINKLLLPMKRDDNIAVVGPRITTPQGEIQNPLPEENVWQIIVSDFSRLLLPKRINRNKEKESRFCNAVSGSFMLVRSETFEKIGCFDPNTFLFMEENILAKRLQIVGMKMFYCDDVLVVHEHGETVKKTVGIKKSLRADFGSRIYYAREYCNTNPILLAFAKLNFEIVMILFSVKKYIVGLIRK